MFAPRRGAAELGVVQRLSEPGQVLDDAVALRPHTVAENVSPVSMAMMKSQVWHDLDCHGRRRVRAQHLLTLAKGLPLHRRRQRLVEKRANFEPYSRVVFGGRPTAGPMPVSATLIIYWDVQVKRQCGKSPGWRKWAAQDRQPGIGAGEGGRQRRDGDPQPAKAINALDHEMALAMEQALLELEQSTPRSAQLTIVRGAGIVACVRAVTSSPLLAATPQLLSAAKRPTPRRQPRRRPRSGASSTSSNTLISRYPKPLCGDHGRHRRWAVASASPRIATRGWSPDRTRLGMPGGHRFHPDVGGTHLLSKVPTNWAPVALTAGTIGPPTPSRSGWPTTTFRRRTGRRLDWWKLGGAFPVRIRVIRRSPSSVAGSGRSPEIPSPTSSPDELGTPEATKAADHRGKKSTGRGGYAAGLREAASVEDLAQSLRVDTGSLHFHCAILIWQKWDSGSGHRRDRNPTWRHSAHASGYRR